MSQSSANLQREPSLVVIGNFDGVHRGHQSVLGSAVEEAEALGLVPRVLTFHPHPAEVLGKRHLKVLTTIDHKVRLLKEQSPLLQVDVWPFTLELSALSPEEFVESVLVRELSARVVVVGENFRFGRGRSGDLALLTELGRRMQFKARSEALLSDDRGPFSSTRVREALALGDVVEAARLLGRPHSVSGKIVQGDQRGRTLGFPTANFAEVVEAVPLDGVYSGRVFEGERCLGLGVANLGTRPTVDRPHGLEVHILDFSGDLYGHELRFEWIDRVRDVQKFSGLEELKQQIERDTETCRRSGIALPVEKP